MSENDLEIKLKAYSQFGSVTLRPQGFDLIIRKITLGWGKLYDGLNMDNEILAGSLEGKIIESGKTYTIHACGRANASSGTEGWFDLFDVHNGNRRLGKYYWSCPWHAGQINRSEWSPDADEKLSNYNIVRSGGNLTRSGALGNVDLTLVLMR